MKFREDLFQTAKNARLLCFDSVLIQIIFKFIITLGMFFCVNSAYSSNDNDKQIWFSPALSSSDYLDLFTKPEEWKQSLSMVNVFKFHAANLNNNTLLVKNNNFPSFAKVNAFQFLNNRKIKIAIETGVVKEGIKCEIHPFLKSLADQINKIEQFKGHVSVVSFDEPLKELKSSNACVENIDELTDKIFDFINSISRNHKGIEFGTIEAYPRNSISEIVKWLETLKRRGVNIKHIHLDISPGNPAFNRDEFQNKIAILKNYCTSNGIRLGLIIWTAQTKSDRLYFATVNRMRNVFNISDFDDIIFQSWTKSPDNYISVPRNLPENEKTIYSHTRLIREMGCDAFPLLQGCIK